MCGGGGGGLHSLGSVRRFTGHHCRERLSGYVGVSNWFGDVEGAIFTYVAKWDILMPQLQSKIKWVCGCFKLVWRRGRGNLHLRGKVGHSHATIAEQD